MPPEWAPHERCLVAWPARAELWGDLREAAELATAAVVTAIAGFEPILLVAAPGDGARATSACGTTDVEVIELPIDDSWLRDSGPIVAVDGAGTRVGVDFRFNSWGEKYTPYSRDAAVASLICEHLGIERRAVDMVLEGGAIAVDGTGTLLTTEQCLLHPSRNPSMTREQITTTLEEALGMKRVVWLPYGLVEDRDTDGHVDNVAAFVADNVVLTQTVRDPENPNFERLRKNASVLRDAKIEMLELDVLSYATVGGRDVVVPAMNFYLANDAAIVPIVGGDAQHDRTLGIIRDALPGRAVIPVPGEVLAYGGGGVHCITQQVPQS